MKTTAAGSNLTTRWQAAASPGGLIGVLGIVLSLVLAGGMIVQMTGHASLPIPGPLVWALLVIAVALIVVLGFLVYGYVSISYEFTAEHLVIVWAGQKHVVDLDAVQRIVPAVDRLGDNPSRWRRFWTGYYVGTETGPAGPVTIVATLPVRRQLLIVTADRQFAISPERPVLFVEEYGRLRRALDYARTGESTAEMPGENAERLARAGWTMQHPTIQPAGHTTSSRASDGESDTMQSTEQRESLWNQRGTSRTRQHLLNDSISLTFLGIAVLLNVAMVVFILVRYSSLPSSIVLHWNVNGDPDRIGSPREIWVIPIITSLVAIANLVLAWSIDSFDRFAARFLLAASWMVQIVAWVALITLIR